MGDEPLPRLGCRAARALLHTNPRADRLALAAAGLVRGFERHHRGVGEGRRLPHERSGAARPRVGARALLGGTAAAAAGATTITTTTRVSYAVCTPTPASAARAAARVAAARATSRVATARAATLATTALATTALATTALATTALATTALTSRCAATAAGSGRRGPTCTGWRPPAAASRSRGSGGQG